MFANKTRTINVNLNQFIVETPHFQRPITEYHVNLIYQESKKWLDNNCVPPFQNITVAEYAEIIPGTVTTTYKYLLLDGQHRYTAYKRHYNEGKIFNVDIQIVTCSNIQEAEYFYCIFNNRIEHSYVELHENSSFTQLDREIQALITNDKERFSTSNNCARPKVRVSSFMNRWMICNSRKEIKDIEQFKNWLINKNLHEYNRYASYQFSSIVLPDTSSSIIGKAIAKQWYLGLKFDYLWMD